MFGTTFALLLDGEGPFGAGGYALDTQYFAHRLIHVGEAKSSGLASAMAQP